MIKVVTSCSSRQLICLMYRSTSLSMWPLRIALGLEVRLIHMCGISEPIGNSLNAGATFIGDFIDLLSD